MLRGSVCGILGFGGIGQAAARLMRALGAKIYGINTSGKSAEPADFLGTLNDLKHVLEQPISWSSACLSIARPRG